MSAAACHAVGRLVCRTYANYSNVFFYGQSFSDRQALSVFFRLKVTAYDRKIVPYDTVGLKLRQFCHFPGNFGELGVFFEAYVYGHILVTHMKTPVDASELSVKYAAQDVFPAVTLHIVESSLPIYLKVYGQARLQAAGIAIYLMIYFIFVLIDIFYLKLSDLSQVAALAASGGKKYGFVEGNKSLAVSLRDRSNRSTSFFQIHVIFKKPVSFHEFSPLRSV